VRRPLFLLSLLAVAPAVMPAWAGEAPAPGPLRIIGRGSAGCIAGAVALPDAATGLQMIRRSRSAFWGAPDTIAALLLLGREAHAAGLPDLYMGDISGPRGGPLAGGHFSHQMGIDADVYLDLSPRRALTAAERDMLEPPSMVRPDGRGVDRGVFGEAQITLLRLATELPGVDRVLVNPAIKQELCQSVTGDRAWLRLIRPWWGHASHMHINFRCPAGQKLCPPRPAPPPPGDGCDASLQWWFDQLDKPPAPPGPPTTPPAPPEACRAILDGTAG
jgi:penicillin-insensitive murein DD-endopeptidase